MERRWRNSKRDMENKPRTYIGNCDVMLSQNLSKYLYVPYLHTNITLLRVNKPRMSASWHGEVPWTACDYLPTKKYENLFSMYITYQHTIVAWKLLTTIQYICIIIIVLHINYISLVMYSGRTCTFDFLVVVLCVTYKNSTTFIFGVQKFWNLPWWGDFGGEVMKIENMG
jgi:hypothetical protein